MKRYWRVAFSIVLLYALAPLAFSAQQIPACRLDSVFSTEVSETLQRSLSGYRSLGSPLSIERVELNNLAILRDPKILSVFIVKDAAIDGVDTNGCTTRAVTQDDTLDKLSVRGGCYIAAVDKPELRCSSSALGIFGAINNSSGQPNPTLLYVLTHELAHLLQKRSGKYSGKVVHLATSVDMDNRLAQLSAHCDPVSIKKEIEADEKAFAVMAALLVKTPYKSTLLSEQGSMLWNIDRLAVAMDAWQREGVMREFMNMPEVHKSFEPTEFPTPAKTIERNARIFICDALQSKKTVSFPERSKSHPSIEQRLSNVIDVLKPIAKNLPSSNAASEYKTIFDTHQNVSDITTHIFRETGVYMEALNDNICAIVNSENPKKDCRKI